MRGDKNADRQAFGGSGEKKMDQRRKPASRPRPMLREEIADLDQQLLRLMAKRQCMLKTLEQQGITANDTNFLRDSWQKNVAKISHDPGLSGRFFTLLQTVSLFEAPASVDPPSWERAADLDANLLRLLLKRFNLLEKMRHKGRLDSRDEKFLREKWQEAASAASDDPLLPGQFFTTLQNLVFFPAPEAVPEGQPAVPRSAFNLAPSQMPAHIDMRMPADGMLTRAWLYLACASGQGISLSPTLGNSPITDCARAFEQLGALIQYSDKALVVKASSPMGSPDKVLYAGDSEFNFFLLLAHYLGRPSRVKITGDVALQIADFTWLRHLLPQLGARMAHIVPKSNGLPVRLECSGILPPDFKTDTSVPAEFVEALLLAAPFYEQPFAIDLSAQPRKDDIRARILPLLEQSGVTFLLDNDCVNLEPSTVALPAAPTLPMDCYLPLFILTMVETLGGKAQLTGIWPQWAKAAGLLHICERLGLQYPLGENGFSMTRPTPGLLKCLTGNIPDKIFASLDEAAQIFCACAAACAALKKGEASLPTAFLETAACKDFLAAAALGHNEKGYLRPLETAPAVWNAPSAIWAMALAVAACARGHIKGFQLGNPGIMSNYWPAFWSFYNALPDPAQKKNTPGQEKPAKNRRRILTSAVAVPPEIREEDWY